MHADFWHERWAQNTIGFHLNEANPLLVKYLHHLGLAAGSRVFLPLCGKTRDIAWLQDQGLHVLGVELSRLACEQFFEEIKISPGIRKMPGLIHFQAAGLDLYCGDVFALKPAVLGPVDAVYDRAALVALPEDMRRTYAAHLTRLSGRCPQLLISFDYDQTRLTGPPFSVGHAELESLYGRAYRIEALASCDIEGGLKGMCPAREQVWHLRARRARAG